MWQAGSAARLDDAAVPAAPARERGSGSEGRLAARFGQELLGAGYTVTPNLLLRHAAQLGISSGELLLIQYILQHWWDDQKPHPSVRALADEMGKGERMVRYHLKALRAKGYLNLEERHGRAGERISNSFDFSPLFQAVRRIAELEHACNGLQAPPATRCRQPLQSTAADQEPDLPETTSRNHLDRPATAGSDQQQGTTRTATATPSPTAAATEQLAQHLAEVGRDLGDEAHPRVSARRAENLWKRSGLDLDDFLDAVQDAGRVALARRSTVTRRQRTTDGTLGRKNLMPYFFATLESLTEPEDVECTVPAPRSEDAVRQPSAVPAAPAGGIAPIAPDGPARTGHWEAPQPGCLWQAMLGELREVLAPDAYRRWLTDTVVLGDQDATLEIGVRDRMQQHWLEVRLRARLEEALVHAGGASRTLRFTIRSSVAVQ